MSSKKIDAPQQPIRKVSSTTTSVDLPLVKNDQTAVRKQHSLQDMKMAGEQLLALGASFVHSYVRHRCECAVGYLWLLEEGFDAGGADGPQRGFKYVCAGLVRSHDVLLALERRTLERPPSERPSTPVEASTPESECCLVPVLVLFCLLAN